MKETGIIMSGNHPLLVAEGKKTMTRRTYGLGMVNKDPDAWIVTPTGNPLAWACLRKDAEGNIVERVNNVKCPYGGVGDRLWVRATWCKNSQGQMLFKYQKDALTKMLDLPEINILWKPAIHLLKADAEIWLEITEVRAERVRQITFADRLDEGITYKFPYIEDTKRDFRNLWNSLNAKRGLGWDFNPWVWPISFKVIKEK